MNPRILLSCLLPLVLACSGAYAPAGDAGGDSQPADDAGPDVNPCPCTLDIDPISGGLLGSTDCNGLFTAYDGGLTPACSLPAQDR